MRVYIECKSILLQRALELFLESYKTTNSHISNFHISDKKLENNYTFVIGKDIKLPFTKDELLQALEKFYNEKSNSLIKDSLKDALLEVKKIQSKKINKLAKKLL